MNGCSRTRPCSRWQSTAAGGVVGWRTRSLRRARRSGDAGPRIALRSPGAIIEGSLRVLEGAAPRPCRPPQRSGSWWSPLRLDRGDVVSVFSGSSGYFVFPGVPPGRYRITFDLPLCARHPRCRGRHPSAMPQARADGREAAVTSHTLRPHGD
jgi:hypothetical protein